MESLTDEQRGDRIAALTRELQHYETYGKPDRAKLVTEELDRLGSHAATPRKRATKAKPKKSTEL